MKDALSRVRPRLVLHIGQTKTGSTSLQRFLAQHRERLPALGLRYPMAPAAGPGIAGPGAAAGHGAKHHHLLVALHPGHLRRGRAKVVWERLLAGMAADPEATHVVSDEMFWHLGEHHPGHRAEALDTLARLLDGVDVRVIAYLRPPADWLASWYGQLLRSSGQRIAGMDLVRFEQRMRERGMLDYHQIASDWASAFGRDRVILRPGWRQGLHRGDVIDDFLHQLDRVVPDDWARPPPLQTRWSPGRLALCQAFDQNPPSPQGPASAAQRERFVAWLRQAAVPDTGVPPLMPQAFRQQVQQACRASTEALAADWGLSWPDDTAVTPVPPAAGEPTGAGNAWLQLVVAGFLAGGHPGPSGGR